MKTININEMRKDFQSIQKSFISWNTKLKAMKKDIDKYIMQKNDLIQKYCSKKIKFNDKGFILYAEEEYDEIIIWEEVLRVGDEIRTYWLSGDLEGTIEKIKVYFNHSSGQLEWEIDMKTKFNVNVKVERQNSPHLFTNLQHA